MLQHHEPADWVVATGETHSVREFVDLAFKVAGIRDWQRYVVTDPGFIRPAEVDCLIGDATKARRMLGWHPTVGFEDLVTMMVEHDLAAESSLVAHGSSPVAGVAGHHLAVTNGWL
jgi:GDPmannose 4,6-dehydratase